MRWLWGITLLAVALTFQFSKVDLAISALFYAPDRGFYLEWHTLLRGMFVGVQYIAKLYIGLLLCVVLAKACGMLQSIVWRPVMYLVLVLILGPLLSIDLLAKEVIDRPRPREVVEFGGTKAYVAPLHMGAEGGKSAASNHAAAGFYVIAFAMLARGRRRYVLYGSGLMLGAAIGAVRVMQGGHFATDIVTTALIMLWVIHILAQFILRQRSIT